MKGDRELRRLALALVVGMVLVVSCASHKEDVKINPLDITSGTWTGNIGYCYVSVEFYADGTYKLAPTGGGALTDKKYTLTEEESKGLEEIGTYTLTSNPDGSYGLEMKNREYVEGPKGFWVMFARDYAGNISFKNGQWYVRGEVTISSLRDVFDFEWTQVQ